MKLMKSFLMTCLVLGCVLATGTIMVMYGSYLAPIIAGVMLFAIFWSLVYNLMYDDNEPNIRP